MADIALGIGTSHSPLLAIEPAMWAERAKDDYRKKELFLADGRVLSYEELEKEVDGRYATVAVPAEFEKKALQAQQALDRLARSVTEANLDALVVIGDDQDELFGKNHLPAIAVYNGDELVTHPKNEVHPELPGWYREANKGYRMDSVHRHPGAPELANALIDGLIENGVDVSVAGEVLEPENHGFGHAYGFVMDRLCAERAIPILPIMLNTYFPPNVPRPGRCWEIGKVIGAVLRARPTDERIGIVASGGLTHFAVDEDLDRRVIRALETNDGDALGALPHLGLRSGNSEILNWIMAAGALTGLTLTESEYIPVQRTPAGTGIGLAFLTWRPTPDRSGSTS